MIHHKRLSLSFISILLLPLLFSCSINPIFIKKKASKIQRVAILSVIYTKCHDSSYVIGEEKRLLSAARNVEMATIPHLEKTYASQGDIYIVPKEKIMATREYKSLSKSITQYYEKNHSIGYKIAMTQNFPAPGMPLYDTNKKNEQLEPLFKKLCSKFNLDALVVVRHGILLNIPKGIPPYTIAPPNGYFQPFVDAGLEIYLPDSTPIVWRSCYGHEKFNNSYVYRNRKYRMEEAFIKDWTQSSKILFRSVTAKFYSMRNKR